MTRFGISQRQLAKRAGIDPAHVCRYFALPPRTCVRPSLRTMVVLDEALNELVSDYHEKKERGI